MSDPQILTVDLGARSYDIQVGHGLLGANPAFQAVAKGRSVAIVSDSNVDPLYGHQVELLLAPVAHQVVRIVVPAGESSKCWEQLDAIHDRMLEAHLDRKSLVVALGGGVVGDLAGFAAASFQRGIDFVQVPTSLLAQVDSSVGGKTGINHRRGKNMVGAFHQPRLVVADTGVLRTLPPRELAAGLAEVIKHGAIADRTYLEQVAADMPALLACDPDALARAILVSMRIKAGVVAADEREAGVRAHLNFGHTFGHAVEVGAGYGKWLHGEAGADAGHRHGGAGAGHRGGRPAGEGTAVAGGRLSALHVHRQEGRPGDTGVRGARRSGQGCHHPRRRGTGARGHRHSLGVTYPVCHASMPRRH